MANVRFGGIGNPKKQLNDARILGFRTGVLAGAAVLNDVFDFTDEELKEFCEKCVLVMDSIAEGKDDWKNLNYELRRMTGMNLIGIE